MRNKLIVAVLCIATLVTAFYIPASAATTSASTTTALPTVQAEKYVFGLDQNVDGTVVPIVATRTLYATSLSAAELQAAAQGPSTFGSVRGHGTACYTFWVEYWQEAFFVWTRAYRFDLHFCEAWNDAYEAVTVTQKNTFWDYQAGLWFGRNKTRWADYNYEFEPGYPSSGYRLWAQDGIDEIWLGQTVRTLYQTVAVHLHDDGMGLFFPGTD